MDGSVSGRFISDVGTGRIFIRLAQRTRGKSVSNGCRMTMSFISDPSVGSVGGTARHH